MRRLLRLSALALVCLALMPGCAATSRSAESGTPVSLYYEYQNADQVEDLESIIGVEKRSVNVLSLWDFLDIYFKGPVSEDMISPFPAGTSVQAIQYTNSIPTLTLSGEYFSLMGIDLSVACCCLSKTVCEFTGRSSVILVDETESIRMEIDPEKYVLTNRIQNGGNEQFTVYFPDAHWRYLIPEIRDTTLSSNETQAAYVLRKLLEGPVGNQLNNSFPEGTRLLGISIADHVCTVNFSDEFVSGLSGETYHNFLTVYSVVNTLTDLEDIDAVQFLAEGNEISEYGILRLDQPIHRYTECIGPVRTAAGEIDVNLFIRSQTGNEPVPMPCRVKQTISEPLAEAVMLRALNYEPPEGFFNPIPFGTELLGISVSGDTCYVDLSERFIPPEDTEQAEQEAVWALVMTLTDLDGISSVSLTIGGESSGLTYFDISEPIRRSDVLLENS